MDFSEIFRRTLEEEGGATYTDDPVDAGSATKYGITIWTLSTYRGYSVSKDDVRNLTEEEARDIYQKMFFEGPKMHLLPEPLMGPVYDWGVNAGPGRAIRALQTLINKVGVSDPVSVDGGIGPFTLKAAQQTLDAIGAKTMVNAYQDERQAFYNSIVANNPSQNRFIRGWTNRTNRFRI